MNTIINSLTAGHSSTNQAAQVLPITQCRDQQVEEQPFVDNLDYLQALEKEANLILVRAMLWRYDAAQQQSENYLRVLSYAGLSPEKATLDIVEKLIQETTRQNHKRAERSKRAGVDIIFPRFCLEMNIEGFDRKVVLILFMLSTSERFIEVFNSCEFNKKNDRQYGLKIGTILNVLCRDYREEITCRKNFSINSTLMNNEIFIMPYIDESSNIIDEIVCFNERYIRYILGDDNLYESNFRFIRRDRGAVDIKQVIMPDMIKEEIVSRIGTFLSKRDSTAAMCLDKYFGYGTALTMLFFGPSGTGKTMMAQALANHFDRQLFSLKLESLHRMRYSSYEDALASVFREASLNSGIVFFDEADDLFVNDSDMARSLLIQIEKARCVVILATNKPVDLDPAMERRLSMKVHFSIPDAELRYRMWMALMPDFVKTTPDVDLKALANRYLFSGGHIKNTILIAVNMALSKNYAENPILTHDMIEKAADLQATSMTDTHDLCYEYVPKYSVTDLQLRPHQREEIRRMASAYRILQEKGLGLNILIRSSDVPTGIETVNALASECGLRVKQYNFYHVIQTGDDAKVIHPMAQKKVLPMTYAFTPSTGEAAMILFLDYEGLSDLSLDGDEDSSKRTALSNFFSNLRDYRGLFCIVTPVHLKGSLPAEFNMYLDLEYPPEDVQMCQWEEYMGINRVSDDELISLVEEYPMHINEIDFIGRQASIQAIIQGNANAPTIGIVREVISRYRLKNKVPVLFGQR